MSMHSHRSRVRKAALSLAAVLAGGSTFTSCDSKVKSAITGGLEATLLSLFDPTNFLVTDSNDNTNSLFDQTP